MLNIFNIQKKQQQNSRAHSLVQCWVLEAGRSSTLRLVYPKKGIRHTCKSYPCNTTNSYKLTHVKKAPKSLKKVGRHGGSVGRGLCVTTYPLAWRLRRGDPLFVSGYTTARVTEFWAYDGCLVAFWGACLRFWCDLAPQSLFTHGSCVLRVK